MVSRTETTALKETTTRLDVASQFISFAAKNRHLTSPEDDLLQDTELAMTMCHLTTTEDDLPQGIRGMINTHLPTSSDLDLLLGMDMLLELHPVTNDHAPLIERSLPTSLAVATEI